MSTLAIFILGVFVSAITGTAAILVGLLEASDPAQSSLEDLSAFEKKMVNRDNDETREVG